MEVWRRLEAAGSVDMVVEVPILEVLEVFDGFCGSLKILSGGWKYTATFSGKWQCINY